MPFFQLHGFPRARPRSLASPGFGGRAAGTVRLEPESRHDRAIPRQERTGTGRNRRAGSRRCSEPRRLDGTRLDDARLVRQERRRASGSPPHGSPARCCRLRSSQLRNRRLPAASSNGFPRSTPLSSARCHKWPEVEVARRRGSRPEFHAARYSAAATCPRNKLSRPSPGACRAASTGVERRQTAGRYHRLLSRTTDRNPAGFASIARGREPATMSGPRPQCRPQCVLAGR
jgi:hypothetical protein